jgi:hypothetical protein
VREQASFTSFRSPYGSVHIAAYKLRNPRVTQLNNELPHWDTGYDDFVGYMLGVLGGTFRSGLVSNAPAKEAP